MRGYITQSLAAVVLLPSPMRCTGCAGYDGDHTAKTMMCLLACIVVPCCHSSQLAATTTINVCGMRAPSVRRATGS